MSGPDTDPGAHIQPEAIPAAPVKEGASAPVAPEAQSRRALLANAASLVLGRGADALDNAGQALNTLTQPQQQLATPDGMLKTVGAPPFPVPGSRGGGEPAAPGVQGGPERVGRREAIVRLIKYGAVVTALSTGAAAFLNTIIGKGGNNAVIIPPPASEAPRLTAEPGPSEAPVRTQTPAPSSTPEGTATPRPHPIGCPSFPSCAAVPAPTVPAPAP